MRGRALAHPLDEAGWRQLLAADNVWGGAAGLWIASGARSRVFRRQRAGLLLGQWLLLGEARVVRPCLRARAHTDADVHSRPIGSPASNRVATILGRGVSSYQL